jgi:ABC-type antimicrobial peptide transport system permease subunit
MIIIYLKSAWRNLQKHTYGSVLNILGLSIGMAAAFLIFLWVGNEMNFDNYNPDKNFIYHLGVKTAKGTTSFLGTPLALADEIKKQVPEVDRVSRIVIPDNTQAPDLKILNNVFKGKNIAYVDKEWFEIFHYDFIAGNKTGFGTDPNSIILTKTTAQKYYGKNDPVGQIIQIDSVAFKVDAVIEDNPSNSSFRFDIYLPITCYFKKNPNEARAWLSFKDQTFIKLSKHADEKIVENKINSVLLHEEQLKMVFLEGVKKDTVVSQVTPLSSFHFSYKGYNDEQFVHGDKKAVFNFALLGFLILAIACINYVNLTTARAGKRSREVSIRKITGAGKKNLFLQFIVESVLVGSIALLITLVVVKSAMPLFSAFTEKNFSVTLFSPQLWIIAGSVLLLSTVLGGIYPAFVLSSFKPLDMLRGKYILNVKRVLFRRALIVAQFVIAIILIVSTIVITTQLNYMYDNKEGYNRSQIFALRLPEEQHKKDDKTSRETLVATIRNELRKVNTIEHVTMASDIIQNIPLARGGGINWVGRKEGEEHPFTPLSVDPDFNSIFKLELKEGRWFRENDIADKRNYILNETTVAQLHLKRPYIGQFFSVSGDTGQIIGIVKDFHFRNYRYNIDAVVIYNDASSKNNLLLEANAANMKRALAATDSVWKAFFPDKPFEYTFLDDDFAKMYKADIKASRLMGFFSGIAIFLCCMGLLGMIAFLAEQKTKEIGIRKVLGAGTIGIATLLSGDFIWMILTALLIASPIAWWAMSNWLQEFVYRIHIKWWMFAGAGALAVLIALLTVSFQAIKAAMANPVKALRSE